MSRINLSNGSKSYWFTAGESGAAIAFAEDNGISFDSIVAMMDDDTREMVAFVVAPRSDDEFLEEYLKHADEDLIIG